MIVSLDYPLSFQWWVSQVQAHDTNRSIYPLSREWTGAICATGYKTYTGTSYRDQANLLGKDRELLPISLKFQPRQHLPCCLSPHWSQKLLQLLLLDAVALHAALCPWATLTAPSAWPCAIQCCKWCSPAEQRKHNNKYSPAWPISGADLVPTQERRQEQWQPQNPGNFFLCSRCMGVHTASVPLGTQICCKSNAGTQGTSHYL